MHRGYIYFWADILKEVDQTQQYLQYKGLTLDRVVAKLEALRLFFHEQREFLVDSAIQRSIAKEYDIDVEMRVSYKKRMPGEEARDIGLSLQSEIQRGMLECIDRFYEKLVTRSNAMNIIAELFKAVSPSSLINSKFL